LLLPAAKTAPGDSNDGGADEDWAETLTVQDLREVDLRASRLALLWACESAMIGTRQSSEAIGFPAALVDAGVPGVVATLWLVEEQATRQLAEAMLDAHLHGGLSPAMALQQAQIAMLREPAPPATMQGGDDVRTEVAVLALPEAGARSLGGYGGRYVTEMIPSVELPHSAAFYWAAFTLTGA